MKTKLLLPFLFASFLSKAQLIIENGLTPNELVSTQFIGSTSISNVMFNGSTANAGVIRDQVASFMTNFNPTNLGLSQGIILSTGKATLALGPNNLTNGSSATAFPLQGDPDLAMLTTNTVRNKAVLEFDFVAGGSELSFKYVFASEEYPEYSTNGFNDAFGIFLSGPGISGPFSGDAKNIAVIPDTSIPVTVNTINNGLTNTGPCVNCNFYVNNGIGTTPAANTHLQYDGFTTVFTASETLIAGQTYHIKFAIANVGDNGWDSAVFIKANSFSTGEEDPCPLADQCIYTFTLADNGGNGLEENYMFVLQNSNLMGELYDFENTGNLSFDFEFPLCHDQPFELIWGEGGAHPEEISVTVKNAFSQVVYHKPAGQGEQNSLLFSGTVNCIEDLKTATFDKGGFDLAPNPARNAIEISSADEKIASIKVYDITGKIAKTFTNVDSLVFAADVSDLARGFYTVCIETDRGDRIVKKLILE